MTHTNPLSPDDTKKRSNASRIAVTILGATLLTLVVNTIVALQINAWQVYSFLVLVSIIGALAFNGLRLIRKGHMETAMWQLIVGMMVVLPPGTLLISGMGVILGLIIVIISYFYASQTLPTKDVRKILVASLGVGALTAVTDFLNLEHRLQVPALQTFAPVITILVLLVIGFFIVRQVWTGSLRLKLLILLTSVIVLIVGAVSILNAINAQAETEEDELQVLSQLYASYNDDVAILQESAAILSTSLADREDIKQLYLADERDELLKLLTPVFETLRDDYDIRHLYIENTDGTVYVRVHNPANFGDDVTYRSTALTSLETKETVAGVEIGPSRIGIRSVSPLFENVRFIGMLEVGLDYDQSFIEDLKVRSGADYTIWITNEAAAPAGLKPAENALESPLSNMFFYASTISTTLPIEGDVYQRVLQTGEPELHYVTVGDEEAAVLVAPLLGYGDKIIGILDISTPRAETLATIQSNLRTELFTAVLFLLLGLVLIWFTSQYLVIRPLDQLVSVAQRQLEGDLGARTDVATGDELEQLGRTLNSVTSQLQETLQGLEQRVAARTQDLAIVAEVGTATATILDSKRLLQEVVDLTKERFNLYHSHIYLLDEKGENLVLTAGAGEPGRIMAAEGRSIPLDRERSLVARAARERKGVTVNDVTQTPDFLPNPLLPDTRSELAVPMVVGDNVIGVFDIQSDQVGRFTESDVNIQTTLAAQLAVSIQNVRSFEQSKKQAELQSLVNVIGQRIQHTTSIEETLQTAVRELGSALGASRVAAGIQANRKKVSNN